MPGFADDLGFHNARSGLCGVAGRRCGRCDRRRAAARGPRLAGRARPGRRCCSARCWCVAIGGFALAHGFALTLPLLFAAGFFELSFSAMAQTIVQLRSPVDERGHIIGVFITASLGLRAFSGVTVGSAGTLVGIHDSLALSAAANAGLRRTDQQGGTARRRTEAYCMAARAIRVLETGPHEQLRRRARRIACRRGIAAGHVDLLAGTLVAEPEGQVRLPAELHVGVIVAQLALGVAEVRLMYWARALNEKRR